MDYLINRLCILRICIPNSVFIIEKGGKVATIDVAVLINGCGNDRPAMFTIPRRVIRTPPKKGYSKRGSTNYHNLFFEKTNVKPSQKEFMSCVTLIFIAWLYDPISFFIPFDSFPDSLLYINSCLKSENLFCLLSINEPNRNHRRLCWIVHNLYFFKSIYI